LNLSRVGAYLMEGCWFRWVSKDGSFSVGGQVYHGGYAYARQQIEITFDPSDSHLCCYNAGGQCPRRLPIQELSRESLRGDLTQGVYLPLFQLMLPFDFRDQQVIRLREILPV
jgi:hypothetical protein